eukprot:6172442-Pleurochrysis_carterae.AAC.1
MKLLTDVYERTSCLAGKYMTSILHGPFQQSCGLRAAEQEALSLSTENIVKRALHPHLETYGPLL